MSTREQLTIDTPEQIALEYPLAGAGSRFLALAIDSLLQAGAFIALSAVALALVAVSRTVMPAFGTWLVALMILSAFVLYYGYFALFEALWAGQTPGKRVIGIRVIVAAGRPLSGHDAVLRNVLRIIDQLPGMYAVGLLAIFLTERNQRLGDLAAGTVVIHDRPIARPVAPRSPSGRRYGARRLTGEEIAVVDAYLARRSALDPEVRLRTGRRLALVIGTRLGVTISHDDNEDVLLEEIAGEYRSG